MDIFLVILKSLGTSLGICAVVLVVFLVVMMFWVRTAVRSRVYCFFLNESKQLTGGLHKPENNTIIVGSDDNAPKYLIHPKKQFWSYWPPGLPRFVQEPVPSYIYVAGNAEPLDPYDTTALISPESLRKISDEAMLKQTWKDVRETLGIKGKLGGNMLMLILIAVVGLIAGVAAFIGFTNMDMINKIIEILGG